MDWVGKKKQAQTTNLIKEERKEKIPKTTIKYSVRGVNFYIFQCREVKDTDTNTHIHTRLGFKCEISEARHKKEIKIINIKKKLNY